MSTERKISEYLERFGEKPPKPSCCRECLKSGGLSWHGSYVRGLITMTAAYSLPVRRLFCAFCRRTFALLPAFVLKFHHYAGESIRRAVRMLKSGTYESVANMFQGPAQRCISILTLRLWRLRFTQVRP